MAEERTDGQRLPAPTEHVHLPGPTYIPVLVAAGISVAVVGIVVSPLLFIAGMLLFLLPTIRWIRDVRSDISELPLEH